MEDNKDVDMSLSLSSASSSSRAAPMLVFAPRFATNVVVAAQTGTPFGPATTFSRPDDTNGTPDRARGSASPVALTSGAAQPNVASESGANAPYAQAAQSPPIATATATYGAATQTSRVQAQAQAQAQADARQRRRSAEHRAALQRERRAQQEVSRLATDRRAAGRADPISAG